MIGKVLLKIEINPILDFRNVSGFQQQKVYIKQKQLVSVNHQIPAVRCIALNMARIWGLKIDIFS